MLYYTIYVKNLQNDTGYIDVSLEDDQLLKDYLQFLDIGVKTHRSYTVVNPPGTRGRKATFSLNLAEVAAIMTVSPE
jgi:hypothetical protein